MDEHDFLKLQDGNKTQDEKITCEESVTEIIDPFSDNPIKLKTEVKTRIGGGRLVTQEKYHVERDETGFVTNYDHLPIDLFAYSYTDKKIPAAYHHECDMCKLNGKITRLYKGLDGFITPLGNWLCIPCFRVNAKRYLVYQLTLHNFCREVF